MLHRLRAAALALILTAAASGAAPGDTSLPADPEQAELVLRTRIEDAGRAGRWSELADAFVELRRRGLATGDHRLLVRYAQAQLFLRDHQAAEAALVEVLRDRPDHVVALPLMARVRAGKGELKDAGDLLVLAARSGRLVLADLSAEPTDGKLRPLLRDPEFILRVMTARQGEVADPGPRRRHDPFAPPLRAGDDPAPGGEATNDDEERAALRADLARLLDRVLALALAHDVAGVERAFGDLRALLARCEGRLAHEELDAARARFGDAQELYHALRLQVIMHEGNQHLRAARAAMDDGRWAAALEAVSGLEATAKRLREGDRAGWARNAEAFELRAREIAHRARLERDIAALRLTVTGIVLPPPGEAPRKAIVNDRIYVEGELIVDADGDPIEGLRLVAVSTSAVRFRFREREFVRPLKSRM